MKIFLPFIFLCVATTSICYAQNSDIVPTKIELNSFVPQTLEIHSSGLQTGVSTSLLLPRSKPLLVTGHILSGLKFASPIDYFNSYSPFDARAFQPQNFSAYENHLAKYYHIQQSHTLIYGW